MMKLLTRLRELAVNRTRRGQGFPYGISIRADPETTDRDHAWEVYLVIPAGLWYKRRVYDINHDELHDGWAVLRVFVRFGYAHRGYFWDLRIGAGWSVLVGTRRVSPPMVRSA